MTYIKQQRMALKAACLRLLIVAILLGIVCAGTIYMLV
jgi:hypothetical protein